MKFTGIRAEIKGIFSQENIPILLIKTIYFISLNNVA